MPTFARLQVFHSPVGTPTRRVAPGQWQGSAEGMVLLGQALVADYCAGAGPDDVAALERIVREPGGLHIPVTRLRFRLQHDTEGLDWSWHWVSVGAGRAQAGIDTHGPPVAQVLGAVWAVATVAGTESLSRLLRCLDGTSPVPVTHYGGVRSSPVVTKKVASVSPRWPSTVIWALDQLGLDQLGEPDAVRRAFRERVRMWHPDSGADERLAAGRIADLDAARAILLDWIDGIPTDRRLLARAGCPARGECGRT